MRNFVKLLKKMATRLTSSPKIIMKVKSKTVHVPKNNMGQIIKMLRRAKKLAKTRIDE
jgi:hypothetical protein